MALGEVKPLSKQFSVLAFLKFEFDTLLVNISILIENKIIPTVHNPAEVQ
jgi:hypothetical protein